MPRARINVPDDEVVVKKPRAPRKPRVVSGDDVLTPKPRKVLAPKVVESEEDEVAEPARKAPTAIASTKRKQRRSGKVLAIVAVFCTLLTGSGVGLGLSDRGEINVVAVVNDRNERINRGEVRDEKTGEPMSITIPVERDDRPNGGLKMADTQPEQVPSVPAPETATTSEAGTVSTTTLPETNSDATTTTKETVN